MQEKVAALSVQKNESETEADKDAPVEEMLAAALLQEKNLEIDHLSNEIQKLEQELESTENNKVRKHANQFIVLPQNQNIVRFEGFIFWQTGLGG